MMRLFKKKEEENPWNTEEKPAVTDEEIEKAIEQMKKPKPSFPWWRVEAGLVIIWGLAHLPFLYVMMGSPVSGVILIYFMINIIIFIRHLMTLRRKNNE